MKVRTGFISNSSSTSFLLKTNEEVEDFKAKTNGKYGIYNIKEIKEKYLNFTLKELMELDFSKNNEIAFSFYDFNIWDINSLIDFLKDLEEINQDYFFTEPYDRDYAYEAGLDFSEIFEGDL